MLGKPVVSKDQRAERIEQSDIKVQCYDLKTLELVKKETLYKVYTRELDRELCIELFTLYTKTSWSMLLLL